MKPLNHSPPARFLRLFRRSGAPEAVSSAAPSALRFRPPAIAWPGLLVLARGSGLGHCRVPDGSADGCCAAGAGVPDEHGGCTGVGDGAGAGAAGCRPERRICAATSRQVRPGRAVARRQG